MKTIYHSNIITKMKLFSLLGAFMASSLVAAGRPEPETTTTRIKPTYTRPYTETTTTHTWNRPTKTETEYKTRIYVKPSVYTETETEYHTKHHHKTVVSVQSVQSVYAPHTKPHHTDTVTIIGSKTYPVYVPTETPAVTAGAAGKQAAGAMVVLGGVAAFLL
ncbi:hypothetical protein QC762_201195 [Podospora pseudocomata]|uniref:Uncharacterized protein n=1 Tax=Podospora pseudocomata TaxID=2093779 RepID=A0ABR0GQ96_9PEZI|nr:hypothetical protein QC762_201195 [Podospora pseudocomata]